MLNSRNVTIVILITTFLVGIASILEYRESKKIPSFTNSNILETEDLIIVDYPKPYDVVTSPLVVRGRARGGWYFEGSFPVTLYWGVGDEFVDTYATAQGEWMTDDFVPFTVTIEFPEPYARDGVIDFIRDNPSDMREFDRSLRVPVRFK